MALLILLKAMAIAATPLMAIFLANLTLRLLTITITLLLTIRLHKIYIRVTIMLLKIINRLHNTVVR